MSSFTAGNNSFALYSYWRSSASWRVRIVLELKKIPYEYRAVNLLKGEQKSEAYHAINSADLIPSLAVMSQDGSETLATITQSVAIIDFLDNYIPDLYPIFPKDALQRARVLEIVNTIACDTHPLQNLRVLQTYPEERRTERAKEVITAGLGTVEAIIDAYNPNFDGKSCLGFGITAAEILLVPQMYNAVRFGVDLTKIPKCYQVYEYLNSLEEFVRAHPDQQPDSPTKA